jgi:hypothetical protein
MRSRHADCSSSWQAIAAMVQQAVSYLNDLPDLDNVSSSKVRFFSLLLPCGIGQLVKMVYVADASSMYVDAVTMSKVHISNRK